MPNYGALAVLDLITVKLLESPEFAANTYLQTHLRISRHGEKFISMYNIIWDTFALCLTVFFYLQKSTWGCCEDGISEATGKETRELEQIHF